MDSALKPRKMPTQARSQKRFDALLDATLSLLAKNGMEGLTTYAIADEAGVPVASLYQYFPNKESVLYMVHQRFLKGIKERFDYYENIDEHQLDWRALFRLLIDEYYNNDMDPKAALALWQAFRLYPELWDAVSQQHDEEKRRITQILKEYGAVWPDKKLDPLLTVVLDIIDSGWIRNLHDGENNEERRLLTYHAVTNLLELTFSKAPTIKELRSLEL